MKKILFLVIFTILITQTKSVYAQFKSPMDEIFQTQHYYPRDDNPYFSKAIIDTFEHYKWKEYPEYPKKMFVACYVFQASRDWWDTQCIYYRKNKKDMLFYKDITTAFERGDGINADGTSFNPVNFLNKEHNLICKKDEKYFNYSCKEKK